MAASANTTRSIDATTVCITFTAKHAERALGGVDYLHGVELELYPQGWNEIPEFNTAAIDAWLNGLHAILDTYRPVIEQFEDAGVVDYSSAFQTAFRMAAEAVGWDRDAVEEPILPDPTTGPVTITWTRAGFEALAVQHEELVQHGDDDVHAEIARTIRDQIPGGAAMQQDPITARREREELQFGRLRTAVEDMRDAREALDQAEGQGRPVDEVERLGQKLRLARDRARAARGATTDRH